MRAGKFGTSEFPRSRLAAFASGTIRKGKYDVTALLENIAAGSGV